MSTLSDALKAMDKAAKGPWVADLRGGCCAVYQKSKEDQTPGCHYDDERNILYSNKGAVYRSGHWEMDDETQYNFMVIAAAPDALSWIAKALPWLEWIKDNSQNLNIYVDTKDLDSLIAQAKGTEKEDKE